MIWARSSYAKKIDLSGNQHLSKKIKIRHGQSPSILEHDIVSKCKVTFVSG